MKFISESPLPSHIKRSLEYAWKEGAVTQVLISIFDFFLIPYGLFLGASPQEIGFLIAIPNMCVALSQLAAPWILSQIGSRVRALVGGLLIQTVLLVVLVGLDFIPLGKVWALILLVTAFRSVGSIIGPAWGSLVSDYLPENLRGRYIGLRARITALAGIFGLLLWGGILHASGSHSHGWGFVLLFVLATFLRTVTVYLISRMSDLPVHRSQESEFTFWMFIRRFRESNFVKFIFYVSGITFATNLAVPYLNIHLLENLHFNYMQYTLYHVIGMFTAMIGFPIWGHHADVIGNAKVLKFISYLLPVIPFLWMIAREPYHFMLIEAFSGFFWGGFNLCSVNFIYDAVSASKRMRCLSYFNLITGFCIFASASLGGYLIEILPPINGYPVITLFLIAGVIRSVSDFFLSDHFEEVRSTRPKNVTNVRLFFSVMGIRPLTAEGSTMEENEP